MQQLNFYLQQPRVMQKLLTKKVKNQNRVPSRTKESDKQNLQPNHFKKRDKAKKLKRGSRQQRKSKAKLKKNEN